MENKKSCICEIFTSIFGDEIKLGLFILFNLVLGTLNRVLQIVFYCIKRYQTNFMMGLYLLLHSEENLTVKLKIKKFFMFIFSMEFLFPLGVHHSLRTKYSYNSDNAIITMRLVNALHFLFVALPQILIIPINSSINDKFEGIDFASLIVSIIFIFWSVGYYFLCIMNDASYEDMISDFSEKHKNE